jgi:flavodoxin
MNKILLVFYSRTGATRKVAEEIAKNISCDIEEIFDTKDRSGAWGYLLAGRDATGKKLTILKPTKYNSVDYDLIIIGTPVWAWSISAPIRTYLENNKSKFKDVSFVVTSGGTEGVKIFQDMANVCGKEPKAVLEFRTKEVFAGNISDKVKEFANMICG